LPVRNIFHRHNNWYRRGIYKHQGHGGKVNALSASFNAYKGGGGVITTLDEALNLIDRTARARAATKRRNEGVARLGPTREQLYALANMQAARPARKAKVKLPTFSIQQHEIEDA
jgi:hypothetical protein